HGHQQSNKRNGAQSQADDHDLFNSYGNLPDENCRTHHQQREEDQIVENAVADRFAKCVQADSSDVRHLPLTSMADAWARSADTRCMKYSSSVGLTCATDRILA